MAVYQIEFYTEPSGRQPVLEWLSSLDKKTRQHILDKLVRFKKNGLSLLNTSMMRLIKGYGSGFYEIKYDKYRIALYHDQAGRTFILVHGFKKERMREKQEIETAYSRLREYRMRRGNL